jgi:uncharacterized protein YggE
MYSASIEPFDASELTNVELRTLAIELARENELLHARVTEMSDLAEESVALRVEAELAREAAEQELHAVLQTRIMRALRPFRIAYRKLRATSNRVQRRLDRTVR